MKTLRFLILGLFVTAAIVGRAQITQPGWFAVSDSNNLVSLATDDSVQTTSPPQGSTFQPLLVQAGSAETITPEIQALADGLQDNPTNIFNYVHDHIRHVFYFGSKKGAQLTLLEKSGNDFDQCALLVALLQAAGYNNVQYLFAWMGVPFDAKDGTQNDLHHWLGLGFSNTNWNGFTANYVSQLLGARGYPGTAFVAPSDPTNTLIFQRVTVMLSLGGTTYYLDPAFKLTTPVTGINLTNAMGFSSNTLMTAAAGTDAGNYVTGLNETNLRNALTGCTTNLLNYIQSNCPNARVDQVLGGQHIIPAANTGLSQSLLFSYYTVSSMGAAGGYSIWNNEPTNLMSILTVTFAGTNYQCGLPQLQGKRLSLTFDTNGLAQLWQDDTLLAQNTTTGSSAWTNVVLYVSHPFGSWNTQNGLMVRSGEYDQIVTNSYQRTNAIYALIYAFEPDWGWLRERQNQLDAYRQQGLADTSRQVVSETMNVMGLGWMMQTAGAEQMLAAQDGVLPQFHHRLGRMAAEGGNGYYVDVYMQFSGAMSSAGADAANSDRKQKHIDLFSFIFSALEDGIIEQLQTTNLTAASTVKLLQLANTNGQAIYLASSTNWTTAYNVQSHLANYDTTTLNIIYNTYISQNYYVLLPQNGSNHIAGAGSWAGYGYEARYASGSGFSTAMLIGGAYHGGYSAYNVPPNVPFVGLSGQNQPSAFSLPGALTPGANLTFGEPVDAADGTFEIENTDLSLGQAEPRGITLSRYYNGTRRNVNPAGMAGGWVHNYSVSANAVAAPQAGLGGTTPAQAAPMLVATTAAIGLYSTTPDPKNWMVAALTTKWGVDQLTKGGVSVMLGKDTVQFVKQPNGVFTPPANCTMTLVTNSSGYNLQQRHGNTFNFDSLGRLTNIVDQYSKSLTVSYLNSTSSLPQTVTDWKSRALTFNYTGSQLTSVSDGTRSVGYGYSTTYNSQGDLTSFTDAEGKTSTYGYDANHQITVTSNALNQLVVSNLYDSLGHVVVQYTQGDPNKTWRVFWSGWQSIEQDPAGGQQNYFYDDQTRLIGVQDALGNLSQTFYDGQNHVVMTVSPLGETNRFLYDGNQNVTNAIDPLGFTNQFFYDNQNNLVKAVDPLGNSSTFGYNSQFSLTGATNGASDWVNYSYTTSGALAGTLASRADSGGTTQYGYDSTYGQLNSITYPNSLGGESFVTSAQGDVTSHTDARGFATTFNYNNRRQLTNVIAPTNLVIKIAFDSAGNAAGVTDARGFTATNTWSATRHLLAVTLPATAQGAPVITNIYDSRDWLAKTLDPYQQPTLYTNDAAGRLVAMTDPLQRTIQFGFDADGRRLATINAANETNSQTWDARGSLIQLTDGAGHFSTRTYDSAGNEIILTNRNGKKWQFQFDKANRLTNTITPRGYSMSVAFNHQGLPASTKDLANQPTSFYYDARGRLTNRTDNIATTLFSYDANNNLTNAVENNKTNSWTFDAYNRVSSYRDASGNLIQYRFDANGNVTNLIYPGNRTVAYFYDSLNRLTNVTDWAGRKTSIMYDLASRMTSITRPNGTYRTMSYDSAGQLTNILEQMANTLPIAWFRLNWTNTGNMAWEFAAPLPHTNTPPTRNMTYDDDNRLAYFQGPSMGSYQAVGTDPDGNVTSAPLTNDTFATYTYDARNRLLSAGGLNYGYDALNNRIAVTNGTNTARFVVNPNATLSQTLMRIQSGVTNYYVYGAGLLYQVTETATATNTLTYHFDYRGSTIALTDGNGLVTDRIEYSLYGLTTYRTGTNDTPFLFNGRYGVMTDPNGLLYMRARYYNPYLCRFLNPDPLGFGGGMNFYAYANGNPVLYLDPFGLSFWSDTGDYFCGVGQVFEGYGLAIGGTVTGIYTAATHPINTAVGLYNVAANPVQAYNAISSSVANTWNSGLVGQGQIVGNVLIAAGTIGSGFATATTRAAAIAAAEPELTEGMSTWQILSTYNKGAQALNDADYWGLGGDFTTPLEKAAKMATGAYPLTTTFGEGISQSFGLAGTGLTPSAYIVPGVLGAGAETVGWLGNSGALGNLQENWSLFGNTTTQSSVPGVK